MLSSGVSLEWSDVHLERRLLTVRREPAKSGKQRHIPLNVEALDVLTRWRAQSEGTGRLFQVNDPKKAWEALLGAAEIHGFRFHDLRRHFASRLVMAGGRPQHGPGTARSCRPDHDAAVCPSGAGAPCSSGREAGSVTASNAELRPTTTAPTPYLPSGLRPVVHLEDEMVSGNTAESFST